MDFDTVDIIRKRLSLLFPDLNNDDVEDAAWLIEDDLVEASEDLFKPEPKDGRSIAWTYMDMVETIQAVQELLDYLHDDLNKFTKNLADLVVDNKDRATNFLDRDIDDIMDSMFSAKDPCMCRACQNARDTYRHVMD